MGTLAPTRDASAIGVETAPQAAPREARWSLAFVGILGYLFVEYMHISANYPVLQAVQIGKVVVGLTFLGWLIAPRVLGNRPAVRFVDVTMACLVFVVFLSACFAKYQEQAWTTFFDLVRWVAIYFLIGRIVISPWRQRIFVFILLLLNLKLAQFAIRSFIAGREFGRSDEFMARMGVGAGSVGFFGNAGDFGVAMCVVLPLAGALFIGESKKIPRAFLLVCFLAISGAIIVCGSRGAVLGAAVTALAAWARNPRRLGAAAIFLVFVPGMIYVLPEASKDRFRSVLHWQEDRTASDRIALWKAGLRMFRDHPLLGVGPGNFPPSYAERYADSGIDPLAWVPHSVYIQTLSELGLAGTTPVFLLFLGCFQLNARTRRHLVKQEREKRQRFDYFLAIGLDLALIGYLVSGAFLTVLYYPHLWVVLGMSVGLHTVVTSKSVSENAFAAEGASQNPALAGSYQEGH